MCTHPVVKQNFTDLVREGLAHAKPRYFWVCLSIGAKVSGPL